MGKQSVGMKSNSPPIFEKIHVMIMVLFSVRSEGWDYKSSNE